MDEPLLETLGIGPDLIAERIRLDGVRARQFLEHLPERVSALQSELGLGEPRFLPGGVLSATFACTRLADATAVVLKLSAPGAASAAAEAAALAAWDGRGACRLLHASDSGQVMLLEMIVPGTGLHPGDDDDDVRRAATLLSQLQLREGWPPEVPDATSELHWRFERAHRMLDNASPARGRVTHDQVDDAYKRALTLHAQTRDRALLHGDFISKNILLDTDGNWWAIDPRPCLGDPCMEAAFWALAHRPGVAVHTRCTAMADTLELDRGRVWQWAQVFAVSETVLVRDLDRSVAHATVAGL